VTCCRTVTAGCHCGCGTREKHTQQHPQSQPGTCKDECVSWCWLPLGANHRQQQLAMALPTFALPAVHSWTIPGQLALIFEFPAAAFSLGDVHGYIPSQVPFGELGVASMCSLVPAFRPGMKGWTCSGRSVVHRSGPISCCLSMLISCLKHFYFTAPHPHVGVCCVG
jgi:hypothetical protein